MKQKMDEMAEKHSPVYVFEKHSVYTLPANFISEQNQDYFKKGFEAGYQMQAEQIKKLEAEIRGLLMDSNEPSERSQEAAHYNWLDDKNEELKTENSALKSRIEKLRYGHQEIIKQVMSMYLSQDHLIDGMKAISEAALKADEGE